MPSTASEAGAGGTAGAGGGTGLRRWTGIAWWLQRSAGAKAAQKCCARTCRLAPGAAAARGAALPPPTIGAVADVLDTPSAGPLAVRGAALRVGGYVAGVVL